MKKLFTLFSLFLFSLMVVSFSQEIEKFDTAAKDSSFIINKEGASSFATLTDDLTDYFKGPGALKVKATIGSFHGWGSYMHVQKKIKDSTYLNWMKYDTLSIRLKVHQAPKLPNQFVFRMHIQDKLAWGGNAEEYIYENDVVLDNKTDSFIELKIPMIDRGNPGQLNPNKDGFCFIPASWYAGSTNNNVIDWDKIVYWTLTFVTTGTEADSLVVSFDDMKFHSKRQVPHIFFNGKTLNTAMSQFTWGQSALSIAENEGAAPKTHALKWVQGNEWNNGWSGAGWNIDPAFDMTTAWESDSLKFKMKAPAGTGKIRFQFEDGKAKVGYDFTPTGDDKWHQYAFKLSEFVHQENTTGFNPLTIKVFQILGVESAVAGRTILFSDVWTGRPVFDVVAPDAPGMVTATAGTFMNLVTWADVPAENNEKYTIYASVNPITDITKEGVYVIARSIDGGVQSYNHTILSPKVNQNLAYHYAVICTDESGNESPLSNVASVSNTAKGVTIINPTAPSGFAADGDISEWSAITPFRMFPSDGSAAIVTNSKVDGDADCSAKAWIAVDDNYLYAAFDVEDDIIDTTNANSWMKDSPDLFIGLYNWVKGGHTTYQRGAEPDYHLRFNQDYLIFDAPSMRVDSNKSSTYEWKTKFPTGYTVEAKIPWTAFEKAGKDNLFKPVKGMRIPIDLSISDADGGDDRQGEITYSKFNEGNSYAAVNRWTYTWIGDAFTTDIQDEQNVPAEYQLGQNYPNPFNPSTTINYVVKENTLVSLKVYNMLGQEVANLVNQVQPAGSYNVKFDASKLSSGVYFYQIKMNNFTSSKKMVLMK